MIIRTMVAAAALAVLAGVASVQVGAQASTAPPAAAGPTFARDVAPIFYKNCTNCHRPGEIAPMSLLTFKDARPWARSIATRVAKGTMPPWHADPSHGEFLNDRRLTELEKNTIVQWVNAGAPEGSPADLPAEPTYATEWLMGQPDAVFSMSEDYPIPAEGTIAYQYFEVPTTFAEDKWIQAMEVRAGNPSVLHHVIVYARTPPPAVPPQAAPPAPSAQPMPRPAPLFTFPEGTTQIPAGQTGGRPLPPEQRKPLGPNDRPAPRMGPSIGGFAPGQLVRTYQEGSAMKLPAGATLILQTHYTANGQATTDRTRIAVKFARARPQTEVRFASLINGSLHIPPGANDFRVDAEMTISQDVTMWSMLPHTHVRGARWTYEATYPDGRTETILSVPKYDFNWQTDYVFKQPLKLPKGTKIHATAWYDNSKNNPSNPDPSKDVFWGDQTWEEMMYTGLTFSIDAAQATPTAGQKQ
ncbi:MAG: thiol-disulfide isomerase [Acidobacteria bacterium]|nr:MAG: thiol-disulfide isomerase [Acidobacteriota bacterium]PYR51492.1 MAG: thiol-disulfide isomerase [Acidobacteriota bacterium]